MRKQLVKTVENILKSDDKTTLLLGDIGVFGFRNAFKEHPNRVFNIGILEQSMISLASGMALNGLIPIVHTIAPFMVERALEQLKVDFGYQNVGGNFISIGASYDYAALGGTHHCPADVMLMSSIPNMQIVCAGTSQEFDKLINESYNNGQPTYFRLSEYENSNNQHVRFGEANLIRRGSQATIIVVGNMLDKVIEACKDLHVTILYYTTIKPFDGQLLRDNFNENIIVVEPFYEGSINYQITKTLEVTKTLVGKKYCIRNLGVLHNFLKGYGTKQEHDENLELDVKGLKEQIEYALQ